MTITLYGIPTCGTVMKARKWLEAFEADAMLLERPIVEIDGQPVLVGFKEPLYVERFGS